MDAGERDKLVKWNLRNFIFIFMTSFTLTVFGLKEDAKKEKEREKEKKNGS